jgi:entericidin B
MLQFALNIRIIYIMVSITYFLKEIIMKKIATLASILCLAFAVTGCNTVKGAGKDIERGGEKVQDAAQNTQKKM